MNRAGLAFAAPRRVASPVDRGRLARRDLELAADGDPTRYGVAMPPASAGTSFASSEPKHRAAWGLAVKVLVAIAAVALLAWVWFRWIAPHEAAIERWIAELGPWAPVIYLAIFAVATSLFLPKSMFAMAGGAIFGPWWGLVWVFAGSLVAANIAFLLGRHVLRDRVRRSLQGHPTLSAIDASIASRGLRLVVLLRMAPISFALMNWLLSASRISYPSFLVGCLGLLPGTLSTVLLGFAARHTADLAATASGDGRSGDSIAREVAIYSGVLASVLVTVVVTRIAVKAVKDAETGAVPGGA